ncbi:MAG: hypothetical protein U0136_02220 [Bdellovibrionota bacterium]
MDANIAVTGIGSLPYLTLDEAMCDIDRHAPLVPYTPQLPKTGRFGQMLFEPFLGLEDLIVAGDSGGKASIQKGALDSLAQRIEDLSRSPYCDPNVLTARDHLLRTSRTSSPLIAVKTQHVGPITFLTQLQYCGRPAISDSDASTALLSLMTDRLKKQCAALQDTGAKLLFVLDEPVLPFLRKADLAPKGPAVRALSRAIRCIQDCGAEAGIHCCAPLPGPFLQSVLEDVGITLLSVAIDAAKELEHSVHPPLVRSILERGLMLWGMVPTAAAQTKSLPAHDLVAWLRTAQQTVDLPEAHFLAHSLVTPHCGTGLLTTEQSTHIFDVCQEVSERMRCQK